jgi:hypothetical protein
LDPGKLAPVVTLHHADEAVVRFLEDLLEKARSGEIRSVAAAWEHKDGDTNDGACFGNMTGRYNIIGRLQVLATQIALNDCLQWKPS